MYHKVIIPIVILKKPKSWLEALNILPRAELKRIKDELLDEFYGKFE